MKTHQIPTRVPHCCAGAEPLSCAAQWGKHAHTCVCAHVCAHLAEQSGRRQQQQICNWQSWGTEPVQSCSPEGDTHTRGHPNPVPTKQPSPLLPPQRPQQEGSSHTPRARGSPVRPQAGEGHPQRLHTGRTTEDSDPFLHYTPRGFGHAWGTHATLPAGAAPRSPTPPREPPTPEVRLDQAQLTCPAVWRSASRTAARSQPP